MKTALFKWLAAARIYADRRMASMLFLGFSSGFPLLLVLGTLSLWLQDFGLSYAAIGVFSLVKLPYSFKWAWAPLVDQIPLPVLGRLGRRRGWAVLTQIVLFAALLGMSRVNPAENPKTLAALAILVAFASASQDIVLDAFRVESFREREQGAGTATFVLGYRFGVLFSGALALFLADGLGWNAVYVIMSTGALVGIVATLCSREPSPLAKPKPKSKKKKQNLIKEAVIMPFRDFMLKSNWGWILMFVFLYKMSDAYVGPMAYPFYQAIGFTKTEIAVISKIYGVAATIGGSFVGGLLVGRFGLWRSLLACGLVSCLSNLMFVMQTYAGHNSMALIATISIENVTSGMATTAFVAYLSSLCSRQYTATQYALLSSLMSLARDVVAASSGFLLEYTGWTPFFVIVTLMGLPGLLLLGFLGEKGINGVAERPGKD